MEVRFLKNVLDNSKMYDAHKTYEVSEDLLSKITENVDFVRIDEKSKKTSKDSKDTKEVVTDETATK